MSVQIIGGIGTVDSDIVESIENDIWDIVNRYSDEYGHIDDEGFDELKKLREKYSDNKKLFDRIRHRILMNDMYYKR